MTISGVSNSNNLYELPIVAERYIGDVVHRWHLANGDKAYLIHHNGNLKTAFLRGGNCFITPISLPDFFSVEEAVERLLNYYPIFADDNSITSTKEEVHFKPSKSTCLTTVSSSANLHELPIEAETNMENVVHQWHLAEGDKAYLIQDNGKLKCLFLNGNKRFTSLIPFPDFFSAEEAVERLLKRYPILADDNSIKFLTKEEVEEVHFKSSKNIYPTIMSWLENRRKEIDTMLYGIFFNFFNKNYQRTLTHEIYKKSDQCEMIYEPTVMGVAGIYRAVIYGFGIASLSNVDEELIHRTALIYRHSKNSLLTSYLPIIWKDRLINNEDIRCVLLDRLIDSYSNSTNYLENEIVPKIVKKWEDLTLDELIRKNDFCLRIDKQLKKIEQKIEKEEAYSWLPNLDPSKKIVEKNINELTLNRFFYLSENMQQLNPTLRHKQATYKDIRIHNCIQKLNENPLLQRKFKHIYENISGMHEFKLELFFKVLYPIFDSSYFKNYGQLPPSGVLFYGPPGCGKSHIAKVLATATEAEFVDYSPGSHGSKYQNETSEKIQNMFSMAERKFKLTKKRTVIFIDEADSVFPRRDQLTTDNIEKNAAVEQFLRNMESCSKKGILVICATNFKDNLDPAAIRDGRIDLQFEIPPPSNETRKELFRNYLKDIKYIDTKIDLNQLVILTNSFPPSSIKAVVQGAANLAAEGNNKVDMAYFKESIRKVEYKLNV
ncbi:MAG: AAA family ATPase [Candidatus Rhabdochlamydia sp.]